MPYSIRKLPNQDLYRVYNTQTKAIHSYSTTLENAKKQVKLLHMVDAGVPLEKKGGGMTDIDKTSTGVMRIKLNDAAKKFLNDKLIPLITNTTIRITDSRQNSGVGRSQVFGVWKY
jgi:short-subunit dehydrogenase involved in D-alanine esterification of teichoic acids